MSDKDSISAEELTRFMKSRAGAIEIELKKAFERFTSPEYIHDGQIVKDSRYDNLAIEKGFLEPAIYIMGLGGKRLRAIMTSLIIDAFGKDSTKMLEFCIIPEVIHTGTLIHDDIEDQSDMRRGSPAVHVKYGMDLAINLGDLMFFLPLDAIESSDKIDDRMKQRMIRACIREMVKLGIGQATDLIWHNGMVDPFKISEAEYIQMALDKTGALTSICAKLGGILAGADDETVKMLGKFGSLLGLAFQIQDDLLNLKESRVASTKGGIGDDIKEGKVTLMVIYALNHTSEDKKRRLVEILSAHSSENTLIEEAVSILLDTDAETYIDGLKQRLMDDALKELDNAVPETEARSMLKAILKFAMYRTI